MNPSRSDKTRLLRPHIFVLEQNKQLHRHLRNRSDLYDLTVSSNLWQAIEDRIFENGSRPDLAVIDVSLSQSKRGLELGKDLRQSDQTIPILLITKESSESFALTALRTGITDYVKEPCSHEEFSERVMYCLKQRRARALTRLEEHGNYESLENVLIGTSPTILEVRADIKKIAQTQSNLLITGETGTGKEVVAQAIHRNSQRRNKAFVCVNCAAIPGTLLESELFGYEQGAFTGAIQTQKGKLEQAQDGTILFDEIGDMELSAQAKVLRAIEERQVHRLGGGKNHPLNIRVIAATNQNLELAIDQKQFRSDLFYRLNIARIHLPPLRERKEDIPALIQHFIREFNPKFHREVEKLTDAALESLLKYSWPGNVRELRNLIEASFIHLPNPATRHMELPEQFRKKEKENASLPQDERDLILSALLTTKWSRTKAAKKLEWSRMTLYRKMAKHDIGIANHKTCENLAEQTHLINKQCNIL
ncbi:MAG: sigma 54-interacting transcriptional regulator [Nitrospirales bacterium]